MEMLAMVGHSEAQEHPKMKLRAGNAGTFLSGAWSAEIAGLVEHSGTHSGARPSPGRKTSSRHYQLSFETHNGPERCELSGSMVAVDKHTHDEGGALTVGSVVGTCSDSSLVLLVQWQDSSALATTGSEETSGAGWSSSNLTGCTLLHCVYGHRLEGQFCIGDRVRIIGPGGAEKPNDQHLQGIIIESSAHSKSGVRKSDDMHGLAGVPQFLVQLDHYDHDDRRSTDRIETGQPTPSSPAHSSVPPTWHTAAELMHAEHVVEIVGDGTLSLWTSEEPQRAVHFSAHRKVSTVSETVDYCKASCSDCILC